MPDPRYVLWHRTSAICPWRPLDVYDTLAEAEKYGRRSVLPGDYVVSADRPTHCGPAMWTVAPAKKKRKAVPAACTIKIVHDPRNHR